MQRERSFQRLMHRNICKCVVVFGLLFIFVFFLWSKSNSDSDIEYNSVWKLTGYKTILAYEIPVWFKVQDGTKTFLDLNCPVNKCRLTTNHRERQSADLVLFHEHYHETHLPRPPNQVYALYNIESPLHTARIPHPDIINWTISYRYDSTIPNPYRVWEYYNANITQIKQTRNYAENKTKKVAWFVSNCNDKNGRLKYARELQNYIQVDIYGQCGPKTCSRDNTKKCYDMLREDYKFYLAFENSNCVDYITEKLFENALQQTVLPIVMGARPEDYNKYAPKHSYIHVEEFNSPRELAEYLHDLDRDDELYNLYFQWRGTGTVKHGPKNHFCELCAMLHDNVTMSTPKWYSDINAWWHAPGVCTTGLWRDLDITTNSSTNNRYQLTYLYVSFIGFISLMQHFYFRLP